MELAMAETPGAALIAEISAAERQVLAALGPGRRCMLQELSRELRRPMPVVVMSVGASLRRGGVRAIQGDGDGRT
jgi:hypothetical protein